MSTRVGGGHSLSVCAFVYERVLVFVGALVCRHLASATLHNSSGLLLQDKLKDAE